jgi:hypothetical protein
MSHAPSIPSRVFPTAMLADVSIDPAVVTLTRKAPAKMAGQMENPRIRKRATAIPAGSHTGEALTCTEAKPRLSLPAKK